VPFLEALSSGLSVTGAAVVELTMDVFFLCRHHGRRPFHCAAGRRSLFRLLAQVESVPVDEVVNLLCKSYGGYLANRSNPKWRFEIGGRMGVLGGP
jgi:hypothetical protein